MQKVLSPFIYLIASILQTATLGAIENDSKPYVTSRWDGQLGNQLFCIAATLAYAWDHDLEALFPFLNEPDANKSYNRERIFFRLNTSDCPRPYKHVFSNYSMCYIPIPPLEDLFLDGPFFCWRYFHHHRNKLLELFAPSEEISNYLQAKYGTLIEKPNTVSIHVRTTSKRIHEKAFPFPGLNYFDLAMREFPEDSIFVVFSDRINWCKKNFTKRFPHRIFVFIEGRDHLDDLYLMSMMKHNILSNLTYSWWGAYLNTNPEKRIYVPKVLARPSHIIWPLTEFYPPEWKVIPYDNSYDPYPADMYLYDKTTLSLDEKNDY